jgi:transposase
VIASLTLGGIGACVQLPGATDTAAVLAYVERLLAPGLAAGQVVVMDNLSAHKGERVRELVEARGARAPYLPPYSPDLNPIEEAIAKLKHILKGTGAGTHEALGRALSDVLDAITPQDASSYLANSGCLPAHQHP